LRDLVELPEEKQAEIAKLEGEAIVLAEQGNYIKSIALLTEAIKLCSTRASLYNNRAQAYRLVGDNEMALQDLNHAIEYGGGQPAVLSQVGVPFQPEV
jgi:Flp pilus assembly protein TadD